MTADPKLLGSTGGASSPHARGLLLDFGGVLTTSETEALAAFCRTAGVDFDWLNAVIDRAYEPAGRDEPVAAVERGEMSRDEFERWLAKTLSHHAGRPFRPEGIKDQLFAACRIDPRMVECVRRAREAAVRTALVSNSWGGDGRGGYEQGEHSDLFDAIVISGMEGVRKPEPEIYLLAASRIDASPEACVFVDDLPACVRGAEAVGMTGILHESFDDTARRLEDFFGVRLT